MKRWVINVLQLEDKHSRRKQLEEKHSLISPEAADTLGPDVLSVRGRHVHVQVANVGFLSVCLETLSDPEWL